MPISATGNKARGFTLLELLVVLVLLGLVGGAVMLTIPTGESEVRKEAREIALRLRAASEEAIVSGRPVGLDIDGTGWRFATYAERAWYPVAAGPLRPGRFSASAAVIHDGAPVEPIGEDADGENLTVALPRFLFEETGVAPVLEVRLEDRGEVWIVETDGVGGAEVRRADR
ncbi:MAG: GspH/FimT family pseudopilin [Pseudomonadota bacterium]